MEEGGETVVLDGDDGVALTHDRIHDVLLAFGDAG